MCLPELLDDSATTDTKASDQGAPPWKIGHPVNTTMLPDPVSDLDMIGMGFFRESCPLGLLSGEESLLGLALFRRAVLRLLCMVPP